MEAAFLKSIHIVICISTIFSLLYFVYCGSLDYVHDSSFISAFCESITRLPFKISVNLFGISSAHSQLSQKFSFVYSHGLVSKSSLESILPFFDASIYSSSESFPFNSILGNKIFDSYSFS